MHTDLIMGLDISTAVTGVAVLHADGSLLHLDFVDTRKADGLWKTADLIDAHLIQCAGMGSYAGLYVEENMQRYRNGFSNAHTISTLAKINGIVTYMARRALGIEPTYVQASTARRICGIKVTKASTKEERKDPHFVKRQVFEHMHETCADIAARSWSMTRPSKKNPNGRMRDENFDMVDAYVIARAGWAGIH